MKEYLSNLLPRLLEFSETLDRKELFIEQPWVYIDQNRNKQQYIFKRDGTLIMSLNGNAQLGSWEYITAAGSLLIDRGTDKVLLNQGFIDRGVLVLKKDNYFDDPFLLVNQRVVPDLNVEQYLKDLLISKKGRSSLQVEGGITFEYEGSYLQKGTIVYNDGLFVEGGYYFSKDGSKRIVIEKGKSLKSPIWCSIIQTRVKSP